MLSDAGATGKGRARVVAVVQRKVEAGQEGSGIANTISQEIRAFVRERIAPYKIPKRSISWSNCP
jgi:hypothetical protein